MLFAYGPYQDLRTLDEIRFWKQQEAEHTVVIRELVKNLEEPYKKALEAWEESFNLTLSAAVRYIETLVRLGGHSNPAIHAKVLQVTHFSVDQSEKFIAFIEELKKNSKAIKSNPVIPTVLNHIERESKYFVGVLQVMR